MTNTKKGFTLIELLVVIAIIGILSSVVLASLNSARNKGADASVKANLANARAQAEIYYDGNGANGYSSVCTATNGIGANVLAAKNAGGDSAAVTALCQSDGDEWLALADLKNDVSYCVDHTGFSGTTTKTTVGSLASGSIKCN